MLSRWCVDIKPGWDWGKLTIISFAVNWESENQPNNVWLNVECYHVACGGRCCASVNKEIFFVSFLSSYANIKNATEHGLSSWSQWIVVRTMTRDDWKKNVCKKGKEEFMKRDGKDTTNESGERGLEEPMEQSSQIVHDKHFNAC